MVIDQPSASQIPQLLQLWKTTFGDHGGFWEMFLDTGFTQENCRCITRDGQVTAGLCWFDCCHNGQRVAYIYAVITHPEHRNQGLCRRLLDDTHAHLAARGYAAAMLVPEKEALRQMYRKLGYRDCTTVSEFSCTAGNAPAAVRAIGKAEYAALRRSFLPAGGVVQEGKNLDFLTAQSQLYAGKDFLLAAYADDGVLHGMELLGNRDAAPGILWALGFDRGVFRTSGKEKAFAMFHPLTGETAAPCYFGFAFD